MLMNEEFWGQLGWTDTMSAALIADVFSCSLKEIQTVLLCWSTVGPSCCFLCRSLWHSPRLWHGWEIMWSVSQSMTWLRDDMVCNTVHDMVEWWRGLWHSPWHGWEMMWSVTQSMTWLRDDVVCVTVHDMVERWRGLCHGPWHGWERWCGLWHSPWHGWEMMWSVTQSMTWLRDDVVCDTVHDMVEKWCGLWHSPWHGWEMMWSVTAGLFCSVDVDLLQVLFFPQQKPVSATQEV